MPSSKSLLGARGASSAGGNISWGPFKEKKGEGLYAGLSTVAATVVVHCHGCYGGSCSLVTTL